MIKNEKEDYKKSIIAILKRHGGEISRTRLLKKLGILSGKLTEVVNEMIEDGVIAEILRQKDMRGRPKPVFKYKGEE